MIMQLLSPITFTAVVLSSKEYLKRISIIVAKYLGQNEADRFLQACEEIDFSTANSILDDTVLRLTGFETVSVALDLFADKFPQLSPDIENKVTAASTEKNKVLAIESFRDKIMEILDTAP